MRISSFHIPKMDCSAEANIVQMKLQTLDGIRKIDFNLQHRTAVVRHDGPEAPVTAALESLGFGARLVKTEEDSGDPEPMEVEDVAGNRRLLWAVLAINFAFFLIEGAAGYLAHSMGLVADSLDMLSDAFVYGLSLYAVGRAASSKKRVAAVSGWSQMALAILGVVEVARRFFETSVAPFSGTMITVSIFALTANAYTLWLLNRAKTGEAHIKASTICTSNDVIANAGVILAGVLVHFTHSRFPDLLIGTVVFCLVARGALSILKLAK